MKGLVPRYIALFLLVTARPLLCSADYFVVRESGDTARSNRGSKYGSVFHLKAEDIPVSDIVFVENNGKRWTYRVITEDRLDLPMCRDTIAAFACAYAAKYGATRALGEFPMIKPDWASDPRFIACYRTALLDQWIRTDERGRPLANDTIRPTKDDRLWVIKRNGDTVMVGKNNFFMKGDTLCWFGGGRMHRDDVLLLHSKKGPQFITWRGKIAQFDPPIPDLSPASRGVIYGHMYGLGMDASKLSPGDRPDAAAILAACYAEHDFVMARIAKGSSTLSGVAIGATVAKNILMFIP